MQDSAWQLEASVLAKILDATVVQLMTTSIQEDLVWYGAFSNM